ncbi:MAG: hypothetical protein WC359_03730 [Dehalococcoidia bacterium]|jgi:hypothetical protein
MELELRREGATVALVIAGNELGKLYFPLRSGGRWMQPEKVVIGPGNVITASYGHAELTDRLTFSEGLIKVERSWKILRKGSWQLGFGYRPSTQLEQWIVPSIMYDKNTMGTGRYPRGGVEAGWSFREDRIPVPSCSILHDGSNWQAVFTQPAGDGSVISSVKTYPSAGGPAFEIRVPYCEEPRTYTEKGIFIGGLSGRTERLFKVSKVPFEYSRTFYIAYGCCSHIGEIFMRLAELALGEFAAPGAKVTGVDWSKIAALKFNHLRYLLIDDGRMTAVKMGRGNGLFQSFYEYTAGSFLVKGLEAATIFARLGKEVGNSRYTDIAERIGDFFLAGALPNGLHRDCYSLKDGRWGGYLGVGTPPELQEGANARCNGEVMYNYLRLYRLLKDAGREKPDFLELVEKNAAFYIGHQLRGEQEGSFGRWRDISGVPMNTLGTNGAYIISLLVELEKTAGKRDDIDRALEKAGKYYASLIDKGAFYADTLDADCVDKEAGIALLKAFLDLYERSHDKFHLRYAGLAAGFVLSWMYTYNVAFDPSSPLGRRDFKTQGMTSVSVAHHHLDFYGFSIACDFLRLWRATGDEVWKKCALAMIGACGQLISSPRDLLGKGSDFLGWQPEQVNQTNWDYKHRILGTKGRFHTCVAWTVVLTLGAMLDIRQRFPDILDFKF